jgi:predicted NBD/HSP70 family sugar kinase
VLEERDERTMTETMAEFFAAQEPWSPRDIAAALGVPEPRVSRATASLVEQGYLVPDHEDPEALRLNEERPCAIGVSIRRRRDEDFELIGVLTNLKAVDVRRRTERRTITSSDVRSVIDGIRSIVDVLLHPDSGEPERVMGLGVELAGHINGETGEVVFSPDLRGASGHYWRNVPLSELLWEETGLETVVQNDANALAIHEQWFGEGFGTDDFAVVLVGGKGVGSGLVSGGRLIRGSDGIAGEIGHLLIDHPGLPCRCGNRGCLETIAGEEAICEAIGRQTGSEPSSISVAAQLAQDDNEAAMTAFHRAGTMLGRALSTLLNLLNPSRVILFAIPELTDPGRYPASAGRFLDGLDEAVRTSSFSFAADQYKLIPRTVSRRTIDEELGARGAAAALLARVIMWSAGGDQDGDGMVRGRSGGEMLSPIVSRS